MDIIEIFDGFLELFEESEKMNVLYTIRDYCDDRIKRETEPFCPDDILFLYTPEVPDGKEVDEYRITTNNNYKIEGNVFITGISTKHELDIIIHRICRRYSNKRIYKLEKKNTNENLKELMIKHCNCLLDKFKERKPYHWSPSAHDREIILNYMKKCNVEPIAYYTDLIP